MMELEKTLNIPWLERGRDRLLMKRDNLDLRLFQFAGEDKSSYYYHFGRALRDHITRHFPEHEFKLRVSPAMLYERCLTIYNNLDYRELRRLGYTPSIRLSFFQDAVESYLEAKIEKP